MTKVTSSCKCKICGDTYSDSEKSCPNCGGNSRGISIGITEEIKARDGLDVKKFGKGVKKLKDFLSHTKAGWFPSGDKAKHPEGVNLNQTVDRENNLYTKKVEDVKTGKVTKDIIEPLDQHKK